MTGQEIIQKLIKRTEVRYKAAESIEAISGKKASSGMWKEYSTLLDFAIEIGCEKLWYEKMKELWRQDNETIKKVFKCGIYYEIRFGPAYCD